MFVYFLTVFKGGNESMKKVLGLLLLSVLKMFQNPFGDANTFIKKFLFPFDPF